MATSLTAGVMTGQLPASVVVGVGALWAVTQDGDDPVRARASRITVTILASSLGILVGQLAHRTENPGWVVAVVVLAAAVSGSVAVGSALGGVAGLQLLLGTIVGAGVELPGAWWAGPLLLVAGGAFVLVLSCMSALVAPFAAERRALTRLAAVVGSELRRSGPNAAARPSRELITERESAFDRARALRRRAVTRRAEIQRRRLLAMLDMLDVATDLTISVVRHRQSVPAPVADLVANIMALPGDREVHTAFADADQEQWQLRQLEVLIDHRLQTTPSIDVLRTGAVAWIDRVRVSATLTIAVSAAFFIALILGQPRPYWLPIVVAFIYKPGSGPLVGRALNRSVGTVGGALLVAALAVPLQDQWLAVVFVGLMGAGVALGVAHHYALSTFALTSIVFVFVDFLGDQRALYSLRAGDTLIAAAIVVLSGTLLARDSWRPRARRSVDSATDAVTRYEAAPPPLDQRELNILRRGAQRKLAEAAIAVAHAVLEPPFTTEASLREQLESLRDRCDDRAERALQETPCSGATRGPTLTLQ